ncbi:hypothetical protein Hanom_Chr13g01239421 [Helianthus anomalus]
MLIKERGFLRYIFSIYKMKVPMISYVMLMGHASWWDKQENGMTLITAEDLDDAAEKAVKELKSA